MKQKITMRVVEQFVAKHPEGKNIRGYRNSYTYFNTGADNDGDFENPNEVRPGCLFGHIVKALGGGPKNVIEDRNIDAQYDILSDKLTSKDRETLLRAQQHADMGATWAKALSEGRRRSTCF